MGIPLRSERRSADSAAAVAGFLDAQQRLLDRYEVRAERRLAHVAAIDGEAQVLVAGDGPPLPMVMGGTAPAAFWGPSMARLPGHTLYAIELAGFGLTDPVRYHHTTLRRTATAFRSGVLDALGLVAAQRVPAYADSVLALLRAVMRFTRPRRGVVVTAAELRRISHPVRLIWGERDPFGRLSSGRRAAELMPDADFHVVPGGHAPRFHHSDVVAGLTRQFLRIHGGGGRR